MKQSTPSRPDFYFGAMSPYSWFAAERVEAILGPVRWRPVFAGGLFKACGRTSWGLTDDRAWRIADCEARAHQHGLAPIVWPEPWPTVDLAIARAMTRADRQGDVRSLALIAMRMAFTEGRDLGEPAVVAEAARRCGIDPDLAAANDEETKAATRLQTDQAIAAGVFGVPTVVIRSQLFWGDDRLEHAAAFARASPTDA